MKKKNTHFVDNKKFYDEIVKYKNKVYDAEESGDEPGRREKPRRQQSAARLPHRPEDYASASVHATPSRTGAGRLPAAVYGFHRSRF